MQYSNIVLLFFRMALVDEMILYYAVLFAILDPTPERIDYARGLVWMRLAEIREQLRQDFARLRLLQREIEAVEENIRQFEDLEMATEAWIFENLHF